MRHTHKLPSKSLAICPPFFFFFLFSSKQLKKKQQQVCDRLLAHLLKSKAISEQESALQKLHVKDDRNFHTRI